VKLTTHRKVNNVCRYTSNPTMCHYDEKRDSFTSYSEDRDSRFLQSIGSYLLTYLAG